MNHITHAMFLKIYYKLYEYYEAAVFLWKRFVSTTARTFIMSFADLYRLLFARNLEIPIS